MLHDKDWRQQFKGSAIKNTLSGYQPQVPTLCVSEHAWHANALLQVEEYTGGSAAITLCQLALGARHQASSWLDPPIRRDSKGQYAVFIIARCKVIKKKKKKHWYVKLQWCYTSQALQAFWNWALSSLLFTKPDWLSVRVSACESPPPPTCWNSCPSTAIHSENQPPLWRANAQWLRKTVAKRMLAIEVIER